MQLVDRQTGRSLDNFLARRETQVRSFVLSNGGEGLAKLVLASVQQVVVRRFFIFSSYHKRLVELLLSSKRENYL